MSEQVPEDVYRVTGQSPLTQYDRAGEPTRGIEVRFSVPSIGVEGSVFVPGEYPQPEAAQEAIRAWVVGALEIAQLNN